LFFFLLLCCFLSLFLFVFSFLFVSLASLFHFPQVHEDLNLLSANQCRLRIQVLIKFGESFEQKNNPQFNKLNNEFNQTRKRLRHAVKAGLALKRRIKRLNKERAQKRQDIQTLQCRRGVAGMEGMKGVEGVEGMEGMPRPIDVLVVEDSVDATAFGHVLVNEVAAAVGEHAADTVLDQIEKEAPLRPPLQTPLQTPLRPPLSVSSTKSPTGSDGGGFTTDGFAITETMLLTPATDAGVSLTGQALRNAAASSTTSSPPPLPKSLHVNANSILSTIGTIGTIGDSGDRKNNTHNTRHIGPGGPGTLPNGVLHHQKQPHPHPPPPSLKEDPPPTFKERALLKRLDVLHHRKRTRTNTDHLSAEWKRLLGQCAYVGAWKIALECHVCMSENFLPRNEATYRNVVTALKNAPKPVPTSVVVAVLDEMIDEGMTSQRTFHVCMGAIAKDLKGWRHAVRTFQKMKQQGHKATSATYEILTHCCANADPSDCYETLKYAGVPEFFAYSIGRRSQQLQ
jgi:hypothetical protein